MVDIKTKSRIIMFMVVIYTIISFYYYPKLVGIISTSGFFMGALIYLVTNPAYLLIIFGITKYSKRSKIKSFLAGFLIVFSLDMLASPRIMVEEILSTGSSTLTNMGAIAIKAMANFNIPLKLGHFLYYLVLPVLFLWLAFELLGVVDFVKKFGNGTL